MSPPVLGLNFGTHDAAAAVVHDGRVIAAVEEERLTRVKHTKAFPSHAITYCLTEAGLSATDMDQVALFVDPKLQLLLAPANQWHGFPAALGSLASDLDKYRKRRRLPRTIRARRPLIKGGSGDGPSPARGAKTVRGASRLTTFSSDLSTATATLPPKSCPLPRAATRSRWWIASTTRPRHFSNRAW